MTSCRRSSVPEEQRHDERRGGERGAFEAARCSDVISLTPCTRRDLLLSTPPWLVSTPSPALTARPCLVATSFLGRTAAMHGNMVDRDNPQGPAAGPPPPPSPPQIHIPPS